ncbi:COX15/CtaA family protein [Polaromonas naphthalenivorans]|uniref:Cytochrome oxidase assembly n=1 Tax=Polaromonas naphthalenivorans (strain CJ2) TaxID=365044 RepID=A1VKM5_POLNA|nr:COX15/CtaA family protein [Polaromonas naphthalenivorans]ABM36203.1 cytochrome oxidase assembly [Polaromonas naphthalenivorans CJ2]
MDAQNLYDLSPAVRLMIMGLVVALGPLAWIWARNKSAPVARRLRVLTLVTLFLTFDLVIFGAFTRLTDSGLGCPDWPGCYGSASPLGAQLHIEAAQSAMPSGPVTHSKAWIEMIHRYLATGVGVLILTLTLVTWMARREQQRSDKRGGDILSPWWPTATLLWVCLQGAFGALTVTMKLFPAIVTLHLLGGLVLLALLRAQSVRYAQAQEQSRPTILSTATRRFLLAAFALLGVQIALGGWVSTNYAVLACTDFPGCQGSFWPAMDFSQAFTLWRELGAGHDGGYISFQALTAIHYVHRLAAYAVFIVLMLLSFSLYSVPALRQQARWLAGLTLLQVATGLGNVVLGWPLLAAVGHTGGAAALVVVLTGIVFSSRKMPVLARVSPMNASRLSA